MSDHPAPPLRISHNKIKTKTVNTITMKSACKANKKTRFAISKVPIAEMRRLMRVYGSIKSLRKRQAKPGETEGGTKIESFKRKFYRWFPDLDERFVMDAGGFFRPKFGHEVEMRYREEMRTKDAEISMRKRVTCRQNRYGGTDLRASSGAKRKAASTSPSSTDCTRASPFTAPPVATPARIDSRDSSKTETTPTPSALTVCAHVSPVVSTTNLSSPLSQPDQVMGAGTEMGSDILQLDDDHMDSAIFATDAEPLDQSFLAEQRIFDDVEDDFFGSSSLEEDCLPGPSLCHDVSSLTEERSSDSSWDSDPPPIDDMLNKSLEECYDEMLGSEDDSISMSGCLLDMIAD